jgi:hypothetical protein
VGAVTVVVVVAVKDPKTEGVHPTPIALRHLSAHLSPHCHSRPPPPSLSQPLAPCSLLLPIAACHGSLRPTTASHSPLQPLRTPYGPWQPLAAHCSPWNSPLMAPRSLSWLLAALTAPPLLASPSPSLPIEASHGSLWVLVLQGRFYSPGECENHCRSRPVLP